MKYRYWGLLRSTAAGATVITVQVMRAAHRKDIPSLTNQDPSGVFGPLDGPPLRIALLGDSSVTAPGVEPLDHAWPRRLALRLAQEYRVEIVNFAAGGSKARDVLYSQVGKAAASGADLALVSVGSNDALRGTPARRFEVEMTAILSRLSESIPGVGVSGIGDLSALPRLPTLTRGIARVRSRSLDRAIARSAHPFPNVVKSVTWGPQWQLFADGDPTEVFAADLFHASGAGHGIFATAFDAMTDELLSRR